MGWFIFLTICAILYVAYRRWELVSKDWRIQIKRSKQMDRVEVRLVKRFTTGDYHNSDRIVIGSSISASSPDFQEQLEEAVRLAKQRQSEIKLAKKIARKVRR